MQPECTSTADAPSQWRASRALCEIAHLRGVDTPCVARQLGFQWSVRVDVAVACSLRGGNERAYTRYARPKRRLRTPRSHECPRVGREVTMTRPLEYKLWRAEWGDYLGSQKSGEKALVDVATQWRSSAHRYRAKWRRAQGASRALRTLR